MKTLLIQLALIISVMMNTRLIHQLNSDNYMSTIESNQHIIVLFYSPTCQYCRVFEPEYEAAAQELTKMGYLVTKVNENNHPELSVKMGLLKLPTVYLYDNGHYMTYENERTATQLLKWIRSYISIEINGLPETPETPCLCISTTKPEHIALLKIVSFILEAPPLYTCEKGQAKQKTEIFYITKENFQMKYESQIEEKQLKKWIGQQMKGPIRELIHDDQINEILLSQTLPSLILILTEEDNQHHEKYEIVKQYCSSNRKAIKCGIIKEDNPNYEGAHQFFKQTHRSFIAIVKDHMRIAYVLHLPYPQLSQNALSQFVDDASQDKIPRTVDSTIPLEISFQNVEILQSQTFKEYGKQNRVLLLMFYHPEDAGSKYYGPKLDQLAVSVKKDEKKKQIFVGGIDCKVSMQFCRQQAILYYPTFRLYIEGIPLEFQKQHNLPELSEMDNFIQDCLSREPIVTANTSQIKQPALIYAGTEIKNEIKTLAIVSDKFPVYFFKDRNQQSLELRIQEDKISYEGNIIASEIKNWVDEHTTPILSDMMLENPDERITNAIKNKQPIIFILDIQKEISWRLKYKLGSACKSLGLVGAYADSKHPGFNSLLEWIKIMKPSRSQIIYSQISTDKKFVYPGDPSNLSSMTLQQFINNIKEGIIQQTSLSIEKKKGQKIVEQSDL